MLELSEVGGRGGWDVMRNYTSVQDKREFVSSMAVPPRSVFRSSILRMGARNEMITPFIDRYF